LKELSSSIGLLNALQKLDLSWYSDRLACTFRSSEDPSTYNLASTFHRRGCRSLKTGCFRQVKGAENKKATKIQAML
jgi:hypothetical protein